MEYKFPKISVITPNYNGSNYLEETILSVLGQNYPNLEYIIIDGGSTDGSLEIIKKYEKQIDWWVSEKDNGMYHAIQKGFEKSTGEIMAWINSDDMYHKNALYTVAEIFSSIKEVNWLSGASTTYDEFGRTISCNQSRILTKYDFYNYDFKWIQQESVFWRRYLWEKAGSHLNIQLKYAGDFELWLRFFRFEKIYFTSGLIGGFRMRSTNQISLDYYNEYINEAENLLKLESLTKSEKNIVYIYKFIGVLSKCFTLLKLKKIGKFSKMILTYYYKKHYYKYPPIISFDRYLQKYFINDYTDTIK